MREPLQGMAVVDVGCGGGLLSEALARLGAHVTGIDASEAAVAVAAAHAAGDPLLRRRTRYRSVTAEQLLDEGEGAAEVLYYIARSLVSSANRRWPTCLWLQAGRIRQLHAGIYRQQ